MQWSAVRFVGEVRRSRGGHNFFTLTAGSLNGDAAASGGAAKGLSSSAQSCDACRAEANGQSLLPPATTPQPQRCTFHTTHPHAARVAVSPNRFALERIVIHPPFCILVSL